MRKFAILAIVIMLFSGCTGNLSEEELWLRENSVPLSVENLDLSLLAEDLDETQVILAGENHAVKNNYEIQFALMTALQSHGFRYLLLEMGYSFGEMLNLYLDSGDQEILQGLYRELHGTPSWCFEFVDFWEQVYEYNQQLPPDQRIVVVGLDVEHQLNVALQYISTLNNVQQLPLLEDLEQLKAGRAQVVLRDIEANPDLYVETMGDDLFHLRMVLRNIRAANKFRWTEDDEAREQAIHENFIQVYNRLPQGKYFGQFGSEHVLQHDCETFLDGVNRFAMRLNGDNSPVAGRVLSILYCYLDCQYTDWTYTYKELNTIGASIVVDLVQEEYTLFRFTGEGTPFAAGPPLAPNPKGGATIDYYQYMVVLKDSPGTTTDYSYR